MAANRPVLGDSLTDRINAAHDQLDALLNKPTREIDDWSAYWRSLAAVAVTLSGLYNRTGDERAAAKFRAVAERNAGYAHSSATTVQSESTVQGSGR